MQKLIPLALCLVLAAPANAGLLWSSVKWATKQTSSHPRITKVVKVTNKVINTCAPYVCTLFLGRR